MYIKLDQGDQPQVSTYFSKKKKKSIIKPIIFSLTVFLVSFTVMNWGAISVLGEFYVSTLFDNSEKQLAQDILNSNEIAPKLPVAGFDEEFPTASYQLAKLDVKPVSNRIVIDRLNVNAPIQFFTEDEVPHFNDWDHLEKTIQDKLRSGVVHYPGTATPKDLEGNVFITGHSSYYPWDGGRYKDIFAILHAAQVGDEVTIFYEGEEFKYILEEKHVVTPDDVSVLKQTPERTLTLMTCTPIGTNTKRLILRGKLVD